MSGSQLYEYLVGRVPTISVGVLTADLMSLGQEIDRLNGTGVEILHFDIMDGCFCPMMTVGPPFVRGVRTSMIKDVHLMIQDPLEKVDAYVAAGADILTVPLESGAHIHRVLQYLGTLENQNDPNRGLIRGVGLNPGTSLSSLEPLLDDLEMVTLLGINPGWGGQAMIPATRTRLTELRDMVAEADRSILLCLDGGITRKNIADIANWGADLVVTGSAVFDGRAPTENARFMLSSLRGEKEESQE